jgi:Putative auto-transporter adhesin, head GIN domain
MKKAAVLLAAWVCFALPAAAHTGGETAKTIKEQRQVGTYQNIKADGPFKITLVGGNAGTLTLKGETDMLSLITTTVTNGTLNIELTEGRALPPNQKVEIKVPFTLLNRIDLKGSGSIDVEKTIKNNVKVTVDGCGSIHLKTNTADVEACLLGQGEIKVKGTATNFTCKIIGCGNITAYGLESQNVMACISGSGTIQTSCTKNLTGRINGSGNIVFSGNPAVKDLKRSGQGEFTML